MKNIKLSVKLIGGFIATALITLIVGAVGYFELNKMSGHVDMLGNEDMPKVESLLQMESHLNALMVAVRTLMSANLDEETRKAQYEIITENRAMYKKNFDRYSELGRSDEELELGKVYLTEVGKWAKSNNRAVEESKRLIELDILNPEAYMKKLWIFTSDHYKLASKVGELVAAGVDFDGGTDPTACRFGKWLGSYSSTNPEISQILQDVKTPHNHFHEAVAGIKGAIQRGQHDVALETFQTDMLPAAEGVFGEFDKLRSVAEQAVHTFDEMARILLTESAEGQAKTMGVMNELVEFNIEESRGSVLEAGEDAAKGKLVAIIGVVIGVVLALTLGIVLTRGITLPIFKGVKFAQKMANGNFSEKLDVEQKDEIGVLASALNDMVDKLREIVLEVQSASGNVASGSEELSSSSQALSQGATEQASSIEEVSSSMEEMGSNINQNAENARQTEEMSKKAAADAQEGGDAVGQTVEAMKEIADKISIIEEIARQTNLLALNAAIEAARAGEHGKGFAVVAAEVRKLAERSGTAAFEISELSTSSVEVAENAGELLNRIVPDIQKTAELVQSISVASSEQASGASQINAAIQQLDQVIQQNASASEEMASTSEELSAQGQQLQVTMSFFSLNGAGHAAPPRKIVATRKPVAALPTPEGSHSTPKNDGIDILLENDSDENYERF